MTDHTEAHDDNDMPLEPRLAELARDYHRPPAAAPRDAMWARIDAARGTGSNASAAIAAAPVAVVRAPAVDDVRVISIDAARSRRRSARPWLLAAAGLAAGLLFGVTLERFRDGGSETTGGAVQPSIAAAPVALPDASVPETAAAPRVLPDESPTPPAVAATPRREPARRDTPQVAASRAPRLAQGGASSASPRAATPDDAAPTRTLYHAAAVQTLSQAEALLVAYRANPAPDTTQARMVGRWARDVLSSTRLLLDSPAAHDPELQRLLGDLELLLAQLVQLSGAPLARDERELIDRALRSRDLLPRIRSAVPSGAAATE